MFLSGVAELSMMQQWEECESCQVMGAGEVGETSLVYLQRNRQPSGQRMGFCLIFYLDKGKGWSTIEKVAFRSPGRGRRM